MRKPFALIIEDDLLLSDMYALVLQTADVETAIVRDGGAAMEAIAGYDPDIVLLDMHLPNVSGMKILEDIRAESKYHDLQVVVITANAQMATASDELADAVLLKPVSFDQLAAIATRFMKRPGGKLATRELQAIKLEVSSMSQPPVKAETNPLPATIDSIADTAEMEHKPLPNHE